MAGKARLLADVIEKALNSDEANSENSTLKDQLLAFKQILIHDITPKAFADVYAQTIAYGMFAARLHDPTLPTFSRQEAAELIPRSNPFLRKLFGYIAGPDIDDRIKWIVDSLVEIFLACDVEQLLKNYGRSTKTEDPIIHFYETFLSEYDASLRKARGVWYTPHPVVSFIVRAVDDILKTEFNLPQGLADTSKTKVKVDVQGKKIEQEVHKVQILDPATGTGTFLAEVVKHIHQQFAGQQGIWSNYVERHLLPRLNGFELLMASYAMAHLQLDLLLTETGYRPTTNQRFKIYLTNSLEESHPDTGTLFANWLSSEANEANQIKRDTPVMCVIGNPPYSVSSINKGAWIQGLIADYKKNLNEKKINLDDDYIKFIRYGQHFIDKNGSGILAYISNNSFTDGITHRQMRKHLLESFDKIYILDLHGNAKKQEKALDGSKDENVFDIMQGVGIHLFIKKAGSKEKHNNALHHYELYGTRKLKYDFLLSNRLETIKWEIIPDSEPNHFYLPKKFNNSKEYNAGISLIELFPVTNNGLKTDRDELVIDFDKSALEKRVHKLLTEDFNKEFKEKYQIINSGSYKIEDVIKNLKFSNEFIDIVTYRPFENRYIYYDPKLISRPAFKVMKHLRRNQGISLSMPRQVPENESSGAFVSRNLQGHKSFSAYNINTIFPLYLYPETNQQLTTTDQPNRVPNLNMEIVDKIAEKLNYAFVDDDNIVVDLAAGFSGLLYPTDILDYIYAVLHSPAYREKYKEFLKIDFPRVPYPTDANTFDKLVELGSQLRQLHLLESPVVNKPITKYPVDGSNIVDKPRYDGNHVFINDTQYFANVPQVAWEFYIGGYQPAQKWLKDRKGRVLEFEDILHYQKIIVALNETARLMKEVDEVGVV